jgi:hypothetical protein
MEFLTDEEMLELALRKSLEMENSLKIIFH